MSPVQDMQLWRVSAEGGPPEYAGLAAAGIGSLDMSRDGKRIIFGVGGLPRNELWALDNLESTLRASR